jgi:hypothetical protein
MLGGAEAHLIGVRVEAGFGEHGGRRHEQGWATGGEFIEPAPQPGGEHRTHAAAELVVHGRSLLEGAVGEKTGFRIHGVEQPAEGRCSAGAG